MEPTVGPVESDQKQSSPSEISPQEKGSNRLYVMQKVKPIPGADISL